jgi:cobalt/nickel transport system permease protein
MIAASAGLIAYSSKKIKDDMDDSRVPLMGIMGAFIFAAQMINFTIPATGSSGHIGGGMLLAIVLGPYAAFLTIASVLVVQAFFFADGGLLALGCNIFNLGLFPCFVAYPLVYKKIMAGPFSRGRLVTAATLSAMVSLQLGAFSVVLQTLASGISALPLGTFALLMQPIHLAIGLVEGLATAAVVLFIHAMEPGLISNEAAPSPGRPLKKVIAGMALLALLTGGVFSWFASAHPDGLEWSMFKTAGVEELEKPDTTIYGFLEGLQEKTAFLSDYGFKTTEEEGAAESEESWPAVSGSTTLSGIVGGALTMLIALAIGFVFRKKVVAGRAE